MDLVARVTPEMWLSIATTIGMVFLIADRWVHGQEMTQAELKTQFDSGQAAFNTYVTQTEALRMLRAELLGYRQEVEKLHRDASDFGTEQQKRVGGMEVDLKILKGIIERRIVHAPREHGERRHEA